MMNLTVTDQLEALRSAVFGPIASWNAAHPHPLHSHRERATLNVTQIYADAAGIPSYSISVVCTLSGGSAQLAFHGPDLAAVAEHARLTLEARIAAELRHRADKRPADDFEGQYGVAI